MLQRHRFKTSNIDHDIVSAFSPPKPVKAGWLGRFSNSPTRQPIPTLEAVMFGVQSRAPNSTTQVRDGSIHLHSDSEVASDINSSVDIQCGR